MQAWKQTEKGKIILQNIPYSKVEDPGKVKVHIEKALISYGDYVRYREQPLEGDYTLGRYAVGAVSETADDNCPFGKATRVVIASMQPCGQCYSCKTAKGSRCQKPVRLSINTDGVYCNFIDLPINCLFKLPEAVSYDDALFIEQISLALNALDAIDLNKGEHVAIFSDSKMGLLLSQLAMYYGAIPILIQQDQETLDLAKRSGVFYAYSGKSVQQTERNIFTVTGGRLCEKAIYVRNSLYPVKSVFGTCDSHAKVCLMLCDKKSETVNVAEMVNKEITLIGVNSSEGNFPSAINLLATKAVNVDYLKGPKVKFSTLDETMQKLVFDDVKTQCLIVEVE